MCRGERKEGGPKKKRGSEEKEKRRKSQNQKRKSIAVTMRSQSLLLALRSASSLTASASSLSSSSACASAAAAALSGFRRYHKNVRREFARASEGLGICSRFFLFFVLSGSPASTSLPALSSAFASTGADYAFSSTRSERRTRHESARSERDRRDSTSADTTLFYLSTACFDFLSLSPDPLHPLPPPLPFLLVHFGR